MIHRLTYILFRLGRYETPASLQRDSRKGIFLAKQIDILFLTYTSGSVGPVIRSFELCRALSDLGLLVALIHINPKFKAPQAILDLLGHSETERLHIEFPHRVAQPPAARDATQATTARQTSGASVLKRMKLLLRPIRSLLLLPREVRLLRKFSPSIVIVRPDGALSYSISCGITGIPYIEDPDGPVEELALHRNISMGIVTRYNTFRKKRAPAILSISKECSDLLIAKGIKPERLYPCPNSANANLFKPNSEIRASVRRDILGDSAAGNALVIGFSGMQASWHGLDAFMEAMDSFLEKHPDICLLVIGRNSLESSPNFGKIAHWVASRRIIMTGQIAYEMMPVYLSAVDLVIMPYPPSPLFYFSPMKMFEALALGKVIVAPAVGQMQRVLSSIDAAFLYDNTDPTNASMSKQLYAAIKYYKAGHDEVKTRNLFLRGHTWKESAVTTVRACNGVLAKARTKRALPVSPEAEQPPVY